MTEIDVTLTDFFLALLCTYFSWTLSRAHTASNLFKKTWVLFFVTIAAASIAGAAVHGFFLDESTIGYRILWPATLLSIGLTASAAWTLSGLLISGPRGARPWVIFAALVFLIYAMIVLFYSQKFLVVILNYLPAMVVLLAVSGREYFRNHSKGFILIAEGILISFFAAYIQQAGIAIHAQYFNHNSTYHLVQAFGLWVLFRGAKIQLQQVENHT